MTDQNSPDQEDIARRLAEALYYLDTSFEPPNEAHPTIYAAQPGDLTEILRTAEAINASWKLEEHLSHIKDVSFEQRQQETGHPSIMWRRMMMQESTDLFTTSLVGRINLAYVVEVDGQPALGIEAALIEEPETIEWIERGKDVIQGHIRVLDRMEWDIASSETLAIVEKRDSFIAERFRSGGTELDDAGQDRGPLSRGFLLPLSSIMPILSTIA